MGKTSNTNQETKAVNNGGISAEQIATFKAKHGKLIEITVTDGDETHVGYFHRPDMKTMSAVNALSKKDEVEGAGIMFTNCWLGGSPEMETDAVIKMAAIGKLAAIFQGCTATLKNL